MGETRQGKDGVCAMTESLGQSPTARAPPVPRPCSPRRHANWCGVSSARLCVEAIDGGAQLALARLGRVRVGGYGLGSGSGSDSGLGSG